MEDLITYIVKNLIQSDDFEVVETTEGDKLQYTITADPQYMGIIIGKNGGTISAIRKLVRVRATLDKKLVFVNASERA